MGQTNIYLVLFLFENSVYVYLVGKTYANHWQNRSDILMSSVQNEIIMSNNLNITLTINWELCDTQIVLT